MKNYRTLILTIFFTSLIFLPFYVGAQGNPPVSYGLAMHGQAKYGAQDRFLSYVNPDAPKGGEIKSAVIGTFDSLNPFSIKGVPAEGLELVYDRLMRRVWDEPFTMYPLIAERVDVAPDRSSITFYLNPKARFHDGSPIMAEDVLFSFQTLKEHGRPNMRRVYKLVETAEVKAPREIYFKLGQGYDRETVMILAMMPVLSKKWWEGRSFDSALSEIPILNGAYRIEKVDAPRGIVYARVEDYWAKDLLVNAGQYNFDRVAYDYYRDDTIALESLKKGDVTFRRELDVTKWQSAYQDAQAKGVVRQAVPHQRPERAHGFIFNLRRPPFDDVRMRKALALAFDYDWVGKNLYHGQYKPIDSVFPNAVLSAASGLTAQEQELLKPYAGQVRPEILTGEDRKIAEPDMRSRMKRADSLLQQAGWIVSGGKRVQKDTKTPLSFELLVSSPQEEKIALNYKRNLVRLGVDLVIRRIDSTAFVDRKMAYDYDMMAFFWQNSLSPGTEQMAYWSCAAVKQPGGFNYAGLCNPALDHFAEEISNASSYDELTAYAHIIDTIVMAEQIFVPLFYKGEDYIAYRQGLALPEKTPIYGLVTETAWQKTKEIQKIDEK